MKQIYPIAPIDRYVIHYILSLRKEYRLTQAGVADLLIVDRGFISNVENPYYRAKYNLQHINTLAFYWDLSPRDFLPKKSFDPDKIIHF